MTATNGRCLIVVVVTEPTVVGVQSGAHLCQGEFFSLLKLYDGLGWNQVHHSVPHPGLSLCEVESVLRGTKQRCIVIIIVVVGI